MGVIIYSLSCVLCILLLSADYRLKYIYVNGNHITTVPSNLICLKKLLKLNLSNNRLILPHTVNTKQINVDMDTIDSEMHTIPDSWIDVWGAYDPNSGRLINSTVNRNGPEVILSGNKNSTLL